MSRAIKVTLTGFPGIGRLTSLNVPLSRLKSTPVNAAVEFIIIEIGVLVVGSLHFISILETAVTDVH